MPEVKSTCCYCGVGCGVIIETDASRITGVRGDPEHPANFGRLCTKGSTLHLTARQEARAHYPELRRARDEPRRRVSWDQALEYAVAGFADVIDRDGPDAVAFYISGQLLTEDYYVFNKLAKGLVGTNNVDTNSRLCMSSAVAGYKATLGADAPPACYADIDYADCIFIAGSNTSYAHPILFRRIEDAREANPELKLIVVDPRLTDTAAAADLHLRIRPGTDVALFNSMLFMMLNEGLLDYSFISAHTEGFRALRATVRKYPPHKAAAICGVPAADIIEAASWFASSGATLSLYCQGLNQWRHGTDNNAALINLHLATGQIGRPGAGPLSLTGQPNAMGGRETGGLSHLLPGYRSVSDATARAAVECHWGVPAGTIAPRPGRTGLEIFEGLAEGDVRAVWIIATNPAASLPDLDLVEKALRQADLVIVQDAYHPTETTRFADVLLPAAQWPEKDGVMTSSERRLTYLPRLVDPPGEALPDAEILMRFAHEMGWKEEFACASAAEVFDEFASLTAGAVCDYSGVSHARLRADGPLQWPVPSPDHPGTARLYADGRFPTPDRRARFVAVDHAEPVEEPDADFPLVLTTGRVRDHWHTLTRTGKSPALAARTPAPILEVHLSDARRARIQDGDFVEIASRRGKAVAQCRVSAAIREGTCFLPFHWGRLAGFYKSANNLTLSDRDPVSRQPELKACAVRLRRVAQAPVPTKSSR
jgi:anaerobic selenocysteine-containing dehydrogenase